MCVEELELDATIFWRRFDGNCRAGYRGKVTSGYERITLLILFVWASRQSAIDLREPDLESIKNKAVAWWGRQLRNLREHLELTQVQLADLEDLPADFLSRCLFFFSDLGEISRRTAAYFFDYRFMRLAEQETGSHRLVSHFSASLANTLNYWKSPFIDVFCETGDLFATGGNERWRRPLSSEDAYIFQVGSFDLEVRLRLSLHEKEPRALHKLHTGKRSIPGAFFRVDPPARRLLPSLLEDGLFRGMSNSLQVLRCIQQDFGAHYILVVTAGSERTTSRRSLIDIRKRLLDEGRLVAAIDFPRAPGTRVDKTAWLIHARRTGIGNDVLMVNATAMAAPSNRQEYGALAEFSGRVVKTFLGEKSSSRWATSSHEDSAAHYRHLFDREFGDGYRDIDGLCRAVPAEEIEQCGYVLHAQKYVNPTSYSASLSGIDGTSLLKLMHPSTSDGRAIYLIGNNGEGKSLLLREVAQISSSYERKTIGIACSTSDRFPLRSEAAPGFENFIYEGCRTSDHVANLKRTATDVCRKFIQIHRSTERLQVFEDVLKLIDFDARRYLMPIRAGSDSLNARGDWIMDHTIEIGSDALRNQKLTEHVNPTNTQIALMRSESHGGITPFRNLSSGEQQIVSLVVKIIAQAEQRCLFLVDEPEISLHVSWQRVLPRVLSVICRSFSCDILVATHSALLISSISDSSSICFSARKQRLTEIEPRDRRSVESVLFKGFHTHTANNRLIHERCAAIVADAIGIMNGEMSEKTRLRPLLSELGDMRRRVSEASEQLDKASIERSLELIRAAREAIQELTDFRVKNGIERTQV